MAAPKAKTATEVEEPVEEEKTETEGTIKKSDLVDTIKDVLKDLLPGKAGEAAKEEPEGDGEPAKRESPRDEEARMNKTVREAIKEMMASAEPEKEKEEGKIEPEKVPGSAPMRRIEKIMGWKSE